MRLAFAGLGLVGCAGWFDERCDIDKEVAALVPAAARDCSADGACFDASFAAGKAAFVSGFSGQCIDCSTGVRVVFDGDAVWILEQCVGMCADFDVRANECLSPAIGSMDEVLPGSALTCGGFAPAGNVFLLCGAGEGDPTPVPFPDR